VPVLTRQCYSIQPAENLRSQEKPSYTKPGTPKLVQCRHNAVRVLVLLPLLPFSSLLQHVIDMPTHYGVHISGTVAYTSRAVSSFTHITQLEYSSRRMRRLYFISNKCHAFMREQLFLLRHSQVVSKAVCSGPEIRQNLRAGIPARQWRRSQSDGDHDINLACIYDLHYK
jgi:hypothetical protein